MSPPFVCTNAVDGNQLPAARFVVENNVKPFPFVPGQLNWKLPLTGLIESNGGDTDYPTHAIPDQIPWWSW